MKKIIVIKGILTLIKFLTKCGGSLPLIDIQIPFH